MFTGLVQETGILARAWKTGSGKRFVLKAPPAFSVKFGPGDSISVNGCCQTVEESRGGMLTFTAVPETLARSTLGRLAPGKKVNLERAVTADQGLGGHIVTGHVDGVGEVRRVSRARGSVEIEIGFPAELMSYIASKGSVAVDGMSLTVVSAGKSSFTVALIPHTLKTTIAGGYRKGTPVNLEVDIVARYVKRLAGDG